MPQMTNMKRWLIAGSCTVALALGGASLAMAAASDDDEPLTGDVLQQATEAALEITPEAAPSSRQKSVTMGRRTALRSVWRAGNVVEVSLDSDYQLIDQASDDDGANEEDDD